MSKLTTCLWFDNQAEEAAKFYTSIFPNSKIEGEPTHYEGEKAVEISGKEEGSVLTVAFSLDGTDFVALNGGPLFKFNEAISFQIDCKDQEEVDYYWEKLSAVPESEQCGWLKDKFGVSWQVIPSILPELLASEDREKAQRVMDAMLEMKKLDVAELERAASEE